MSDWLVGGLALAVCLVAYLVIEAHWLMVQAMRDREEDR